MAIILEKIYGPFKIWFTYRYTAKSKFWITLSLLKFPTLKYPWPNNLLENYEEPLLRLNSLKLITVFHFRSRAHCSVKFFCWKENSIENADYCWWKNGNMNDITLKIWKSSRVPVCGGAEDTYYLVPFLK